jgi:hypothetical protein
VPGNVSVGRIVVEYHPVQLDLDGLILLRRSRLQWRRWLRAWPGRFLGFTAFTRTTLLTRFTHPSSIDATTAQVEKNAPSHHHRRRVRIAPDEIGFS